MLRVETCRNIHLETTFDMRISKIDTASSASTYLSPEVETEMAAARGQGQDVAVDDTGVAFAAADVAFEATARRDQNVLPRVSVFPWCSAV
jgi:hypothetical protein